MILKKLVFINNRISKVWLDKTNKTILYINTGANTKVAMFKYELIGTSVYDQIDECIIKQFTDVGNSCFKMCDDYTLVNIKLN